MKVVSHQDPLTAQTEVEQWAFQANATVDKLAEQAYGNYPDLRRVWETLLQQLEEQQQIRSKTHTMYIEIGKLAVQTPKPKELSKATPPTMKTPQVNPVELPAMTVHTIRRSFHCDTLRTVLDWLQQFGTGECKLISWYQLNFWYEHQTGSRGVEHDGRTHRWHTKAPTSTADFPRRSSQLSAYIQGMWAAHGLRIPTFHARSSSCILTFWTRCVPVRIPVTLWTQMEQTMLRIVPQLPSVKAIREHFQ
eukprot:Skav236357  [mRNA]  locus=scaffold2008:85884:86630:- [translate_table: standard]